MVRRHPLLQGFGEVRGGTVVEPGDPQHQQIADPIREHGLRRHHRPFQFGGARPAVMAAPAQPQGGALGTGNQPGDRSGILAAHRHAVHRQHAVARPHACHCGRTVGYRGAHQDDALALPQSEANAGGAVAPGPILCRLARRDVTRVGVEVVEQLVEEALDDALGAGAPHRRRCGDRRFRQTHGCRRPRFGRIDGRQRLLCQHAITPGQHQFAVLLPRGQVRIQRRQAAQAPDRQRRHRHRIQDARLHERQRNGIDVGDQARIEAAIGSRLRVRRHDHQQEQQDGEAVHLWRDRFPGCCVSGTTWKTRPPVTGLASARRTSTSCASRKTCRVRRPVNVCSRSSCCQ